MEKRVSNFFFNPVRVRSFFLTFFQYELPLYRLKIRVRTYLFSHCRWKVRKYVEGEVGLVEGHLMEHVLFVKMTKSGSACAPPSPSAPWFHRP